MRSLARFFRIAVGMLIVAELTALGVWAWSVEMGVWR
jgi:hypothetical protein